MANPTNAPASAPVVAADQRGYFHWSAIFAGTAVALATGFVFVGFGSAIGLGLVSPWNPEGSGVTTVGILTAVWFLVSTALAYYAGGYVAGRMRPQAGDAATASEVEMRDALHGAVVWALGVFAFVWIAISAVTSVATGAAQVGATAASAVGSAVAEAVDTVGGYTVDKLVRTSPPISASRANEVRDQGAQILARAIADGELSGDDRTYLAELVASRTDLTQEEAEARVDEVYAEAQAAADQAAEAAEEATDAAQNATLLMGFLTATGFLIALVAAWFGAVSGGSHRDSKTVSRVFVTTVAR